AAMATSNAPPIARPLSSAGRARRPTTRPPRRVVRPCPSASMATAPPLPRSQHEIYRESTRSSTRCAKVLCMSEPIRWMGTREACERLGVTLRPLYRFIDEGQLPAYKMGRVIRLQESDIDG